MKRVSVFCGSSFGATGVYKDIAFELGKTLAEQGIGLVYGGANVGLMGAVADGALSKNGEVIGVLPHFLQRRELAHTRLAELHLVETMHERKLKMNELCDGVIALPGGMGTLEELFEMLTWGQLGLHSKPVALLNVAGFYDTLIAFLQETVQKGFLREENRSMLLVGSSVRDTLEQMRSYQPQVVAKWISPQTA
ncbi:MAG: TIGR00730 family Rossman fold protein [Candidatus Kapaibacterium sp.]|nr:MAG: TIGR00730 family Rossman fold protein [Candidatus Kapabacteria bacterium]